MTAPSFTIVIPTYQRSALVTGALTSLAAVRYDGGWNVVVVIDGSTDGTRAAIEAEKRTFPLTIIEQDNAGLAAARNAGAAAANGEILLFLDDDMRVAPDLLQRHREAYAAGTAAVAGWIGLDEASSPGFIASGVGEWTKGALGKAGLSDPFSLYGGHFSVRMADFQQAGGFDAAYTSNGGYGREDTDLAVRLMAGGSIAQAPGARAWQVHAVPVAEMLARACEQGRADTRFAKKHPRHAQALLKRTGATRPLDRLMLRPLSALPGLPALMTAIAGRSGFAKARLFDLARRINWWSGVRAAGGYPACREVLALCYHAIADHSDDPVLAPYSIPPEMFASHIALLKDRGFHFVTADTALAVARGEAVVPRKSVLLTFDDGYDDLPGAVRQYLQPHAIPALAFLVSGRLGGTNAWDQPAGAHSRQLVDRQDALALIEAGATLGSHSRTHADLKGLSPADLESEIAGPRHDFVAAGLPSPGHFAYPFGEKDSGSKRVVEASGYIAGWGLADRRIGPSSNLYDLPRVMMHSIDTPWRFRFKTRFPTLATILRHWPFVSRP